MAPGGLTPSGLAAALLAAALALLVAVLFVAVLFVALGAAGGAVCACAKLAAPHTSAPAIIAVSTRRTMMRSGSLIIVTGRWPDIGCSQRGSHSRETFAWEGSCGGSRLSFWRAPHAVAPTARHSIAANLRRRMSANVRRHPAPPSRH